MLTDHLFYGCRNLRSIELPEGVTEIQSDALNDCGLVEITLPEKIQKISPVAVGGDRFTEFRVSSDSRYFYTGKYGELYLRNGSVLIAMPSGRTGYVELPDSVCGIGRHAFCKSRISKIKFGSGVEIVGNSAFSDSELEEVEFNGSLKYISHSAFRGCRLKTVSIPDGCAVEGDAFEGCPLTEVNYHGASSLDLPDECMRPKVYVPKNDLKARADQHYRDQDL